MDTTKKQPATSLSSVQYLGRRDPASTLDIQRRMQEKGVIDLRTQTTAMASRPHAVHSKCSQDDIEFSVPNGKRTRQQRVYTTNISKYAITLQQRWDAGAFRWVHKGYYAPDPRVPGDTGGPQNGQLCVLKEFKTGSVYEEHFFTKDIRAVDKAGEIIRAFVAETCVMPGAKPILLNQPKVWEDIYPDKTGKKKKKLVEPMLEGKFLKFNSNSGFCTPDEYMQALSHYSYHMTNGKYVLCDLQGGHYEDMYILTDPVIMSLDNTKQYGSGDLGAEGIENFFAHHVCGKFCRSHWLKPAKPMRSERIPVQASTSFSLTLGTKQSEAERKQSFRLFWPRAIVVRTTTS